MLVKSAVELDDTMSAVGTAGSRKKEILMQQIEAWTTRANFTFPFKTW